MTLNRKNLRFSNVVTAIRQVHEHCATQVKLAVNMNLTLRNWKKVL